jgi:hypothetical protein
VAHTPPAPHSSPAELVPPALREVMEAELRAEFREVIEWTPPQEVAASEAAPEVLPDTGELLDPDEVERDD